MTTPKPRIFDPIGDFDPSEFAHHLEGLELTDDQAEELIRALAEIMLAFVDLGFGIAPSQKSCGQREIASRFLAGGLSKMVHSTEETAATKERAEQEGV